MALPTGIWYPDTYITGDLYACLRPRFDLVSSRCAPLPVPLPLVVRDLAGGARAPDDMPAGTAYAAWRTLAPPGVAPPS